MTDPFVKTRHVLKQQTSVANLLFIALGLILLLAWLALAVGLPLSQTVASVSGRMVSAMAPSRIVANTDERISALPVQLGDLVQRGDRLVLFDQQGLAFERTGIEQAQRERRRQLANLRAEIGFARKDYDSRLALLSSNEERVRARIEQVTARIDYSQVAVRIYRDLRSERQIDELKFREAQANLKQERQELAALNIEALEVSSRRDSAEQNWRSVTARLERQASALEGEIAQAQTELEQVSYRLSQLELRAPHDAVVEGVAALSVGQSVAKNAWLMTLSPLGDFRFEAKFRATEAAGRITPGAVARIHFTSLPWTEFGMLQAQVSRVGNEEVDGLFTVLLRFDQTQRLAQFAHHGLTGEAIVEVDQITLLQRLLRLIT